MTKEATTETLARGWGLLGHDADGERVYARLQIRGRGGTYVTTDHEDRRHVLELSGQHETYPPGRRPGAEGMRGEPSSCGAGLPAALRSVTRPAPGWTRSQLLGLAAIVEVFHMNTLEAGCAHQTVVWEDSEYGRRPSLSETAPCPHTGYRYGSAWLVREIPSETVGAIVEAIHKLGSASETFPDDPPIINEDRLGEFLTGPLVSSAGN